MKSVPLAPMGGAYEKRWTARCPAMKFVPHPVLARSEAVVKPQLNFSAIGFVKPSSGLKTAANPKT